MNIVTSARKRACPVRSGLEVGAAMSHAYAGTPRRWPACTRLVGWMLTAVVLTVPPHAVAQAPLQLATVLIDTDENGSGVLRFPVLDGVFVAESFTVFGASQRVALFLGGIEVFTGSVAPAEAIALDVGAAGEIEIRIDGAEPNQTLSTELGFRYEPAADAAAAGADARTANGDADITSAQPADATSPGE